MHYLRKHNGLIILFLTFLGVIIAFLTWQYPKSSNTVINSNIGEIDTGITTQTSNFKGSVFDVVKILSSKNTQLEKKQFLEKYSGMKVKSTGYVIDVSEGAFDGYILLISKEPKGYTDVVCLLDESWNKIIQILTVPSEISFEGVFDNGGAYVSLKDCSLK